MTRLKLSQRSDTPATVEPPQREESDIGTTHPKRAEARRLWEEERLTARRVAETVGVHHASVSRWIAQDKASGNPWHREGDPRPKVPTDEELEEMRKRRQRAEDAARAHWAMRRAEEADQAGVMAQIIRTRIAATIASHEGQPVRGKVSAEDALATQRLTAAYEKFVDVAQLLSGGPTGALAVGRMPEEPEASPDDVAEQMHRRRLALVPEFRETGG